MIDAKPDHSVGPIMRASVPAIRFAGDPVTISVHTRSIAWLTTVDGRCARRPSSITPRPVVTGLRCADAGCAGSDGQGMYR